MGGRAHRTTAEHHGTLKRADCVLKSPFFFLASPDFLFAFSPPLSQYLTFQLFRNAVHLSEGRNRETGVMGGRAQRTTAEPHGAPRNTQKGQLRPQVHLFFTRLAAFPLLVFASPHPAPNP